MLGKKPKFSYFICFLPILLALCSFLAEAGELHNGWHFSGDTFTVEGDVYGLTHYDFYDERVVLKVNQNGYIIPEGSCKSTSTREYCITEIYRNISESTENDHIKFEEGVPYAGIHVVVRTLGPDISVSRSFSDSSPELNEEVTVTVTIENKAVFAAESFVYQDILPSSGIIITSISEAQRSGNTINFNYKPGANSKKSFTYTFKIIDYIEFTTKPTASYTYSGETTNISIGSATLKVARPYSFSPSTSPASVEATDQGALSIKITNEVTKDIDVTELKITIPTLLSPQAKPGELEINDNTYSWSGLIKPDEFKLINILLTPARSGTFNIPVSLKVKDSAGKEFNESKNLSIKSTINPIVPILSIIEKSVSEGGTYRVAFSVKNPNKKVGFKNINVSLKSELFEEMNVALAELMPDKIQTLIINNTLEAPFLDTRKDFEIIASGTYETTTKERFNFSHKDQLTVTPVSDIITIMQSADKSLVRIGENFTVTVKIKNNNQEAIKVYSYDQYDPLLDLLGGEISDTLFFDQAGTKEAYIYKLQVPLDYALNETKITTIATIAEKTYTANANLVIKVNTSKIEKEEKPEPEKEKEPEQPPPQVEEKKQGFIAQIINGITDFFKRLFGKK